MEHKLISVPLPTDDRGFLPRSCPRCSKRFEIHLSSYEAGHFLNLRCPYCRFIAEFEEFLTSDQAEYAEDLVRNEALGMAEDQIPKAVEDLLAGMDAGAFEIEGKSGDVRFDRESVADPLGQASMEPEECEGCGFLFGVDSNYERETHCPVCR